MPTVSVKVEIPEGWELACEEMRFPKCGESYLSIHQNYVCAADDGLNARRVIVRPTWKFPSDKLPGAVCIVRGSSSDYYALATKPACDGHYWGEGISDEESMSLLDCEVCMGITLPPASDDWRNDIWWNPDHPDCPAEHK